MLETAKGSIMLKSTLLFIVIVADISAKEELPTTGVVKVAQSVAQEPEFKNNLEIRSLISKLGYSDLYINKLKRYAKDNNLEGLF